MRKSETSIVKSIISLLRAEKWWAMKIHGSAFQPAGIPDILALKDGKVLFLEVKRKGENPSKIQTHTIEKLQSAGAATAIVRSRDDVLALLAMMNERSE